MVYKAGTPLEGAMPVLCNATRDYRPIRECRKICKFYKIEDGCEKCEYPIGVTKW